MSSRKRRYKRKRKLTNLAKGLLCLLLLLFVFIFYKSQTSEVLEKEEKKEAEVEIVPKKKEYNASLVMVGDALIHSSIYEDALSGDSYNFKPMLEEIKKEVKDDDLKYYNQETILGGVELGLSNYPRFNSPYEVGDAFIDSGFNLVSLATNHTMDKGEVGVLNSLNYWNSKKKVLTAGSYSSFEDRDKAKIKEINGIKYALLSYTTWTNGLSTPEGKEYLNNVYNEELVKNDVSRVREEADVVMVAMHWGIEYSFGVSSNQEEIANYLASLGVDIVIGSHPHVVEPIDFIGKTMVIYSLGNFISDQVGLERLTGLMVRVNIHKTVENDITTVSLENASADLLYTYSSMRGKRNFKVYPYSSLTEEILPNFRTYYNDYKEIVLSRTNEVSMKEL